MKKKTKKYLLAALSLLLILSNFSFATSYMICGMSDNDSKCSCEHKSHAPAKELSFNRESAGCCSEGTVELANSNLLTSVKTEKPLDITSFSALIISNADVALTSSFKQISFVSQIEHVPKTDIPILCSSLLI